MVAAAVLIVRGVAGDVGQAEAILRQARPGVRLNGAQRSLVERLLATQRPEDSNAINHP
jgi:hypothetical protein